MSINNAKDFVIASSRSRAVLKPAEFLAECQEYLSAQPWATAILARDSSPESKLSILRDFALRASAVEVAAPKARKVVNGAATSVAKGVAKEKAPAFDLSKPCVRLYNEKGEHVAELNGRKLGGNYDGLGSAERNAAKTLAERCPSDWTAVVSFQAKDKSGNPKVYETRMDNDKACSIAWGVRHHPDASKRTGVSPRAPMKPVMSVNDDGRGIKFSRG